MSTPTRAPAGVPAGGQFTAHSHPEPDLTLGASPAEVFAPFTVPDESWSSFPRYPEYADDTDRSLAVNGHVVGGTYRTQDGLTAAFGPAGFLNGFRDDVAAAASQHAALREGRVNVPISAVKDGASSGDGYAGLARTAERLASGETAKVALLGGGASPDDGGRIMVGEGDGRDDIGYVARNADGTWRSDGPRGRLTGLVDRDHAVALQASFLSVGRTMAPVEHVDLTAIPDREHVRFLRELSLAAASTPGSAEATS